jgi:NADPH:quinone reductase-like Zn-dependent oxidoreductase
LLIKAIGLNRSEILTRSGKAVTKPTLPTQLGLEAAGTIEALRSDVDGLAIGDKVAAIPGEAGRGYYGELALAPARTLVKIPHDQSWQEAAATWMAFATAWTGLIDIAPPLGGSDSIDNGSIEQAGKVRHFGLSEAAADTIRRAHAEAKDDYRLKRCMAGQ